jgi:2-polyprenyl-3-methyl-5-hydroxy-6-metoxy-1,4-benzoquinol methylase
MISTLKAFLPIPLKRVILSFIAPFSKSARERFAPGPISGSGRGWVTMDQIQTELAQAEKARNVSEGEYVRALQSFWVELPPPPSDPWSDEYKQHWLSVYQTLTKNVYDVSKEGHEFDLQAFIKKPYPYNTESFEIVGNQLIAIGSLIRAMQLPPKASILELGPGWGNTSLALAQMGHDVTTIDIEARYTEIQKIRATMLDVPLKVVHGDFFKIREITKAFDAVLFFESFHHCIDHLALLDEIPARLLPGGKLILAGETINESIPYDWGLNPNGEAIFQIVTKGWMELSFRESYLLKTLKRKGWEVKKYDSTQTAAAIVYVCTRADTQ